MRQSVFVPVLWFAAACGDIDVRSVRSGNAVPATLAGDWRGTWRSELTAANGSVQVQVQQFAGEPLVGLQISNPCIGPRNYELVLSANTVDLRADGVSVFAAELSPERVLTGTYQCDLDRGTWTAAWQRDLPPIGDLTGAWEGTIATSGQPPRALSCDLVQGVERGALTLSGSLLVPELLAIPLPVVGNVVWRDATFDVVWQTRASGLPVLLFSALGDRDPLGIELGVVQAFPQGLLPFNQAVFSLRPRP